MSGPRLSDLSSQQWKSGIAAWLGWLFDGLDMHLYVLVATPFVALLLDVSEKDPSVGYYSSWIQAAFLFGWALGGGFFGRIGDRIGRSRALMLTILTYASFTGLSYFAQTWWQLLIFRFLAALGIGGEWAVGASLLSETWPKRWRPWMAAVLQTGVNIGVMLASLVTIVLAGYRREVFLVGVLPALLVLGICRAVPETEEWQGAKQAATCKAPRFLDLFSGPVSRTTWLTLAVCTLSLTAHWAFLFWMPQHLRQLPEVAGWTDQEKDRLVSRFYLFATAISIAGNFVAAGLALVAGISAGDRHLVYGLLRVDGLHLGRTARHRRPVVGSRSHRPVYGCLRPVHHVSAAAFSHAAQDHGRRILLQHRSNRRRRGHGRFRAVLQGGRSPDGAAVRRVSLRAAGAVIAWLLPEPPDEKSVRMEG